MPTPLLAYFILLIVLLLLSAFFSSAETTLFSLSKLQLANFKKSTNPLAKQLIQLVSKPRDVLVTILFGNETSNIAISIIVASLVYHLIGEKHATLISVSIATLLLLIFGEILPKNFAILNATALAPFTAFLLRPLYLFLKPVRTLLVKFSEWVIARFGGELKKEPPLAIEEEFRYLVELGASTGQVDEEERQLIHNVFEFGDKIVSQAMTPFSQIFSLSIEMPYEELLRQIKATQFSRIPIYENNPQNIIGFLYLKDLFTFDRRWKKDPSLSIKEILRSPLFLYQKKGLEETLQAFLKNRIHLAVVVNAQNIPVGLVTMHDVIGELFGEVEE